MERVSEGLAGYLRTFSEGQSARQEVSKISLESYKFADELLDIYGQSANENDPINRWRWTDSVSIKEGDRMYNLFLFENKYDIKEIGVGLWGVDDKNHGELEGILLSFYFPYGKATRAVVEMEDWNNKKITEINLAKGAQELLHGMGEMLEAGRTNGTIYRIS